ncbi:hypothetical protein EWM64_g6180 [Hericium alpestre]|uniref:Ketoreductase (KR) domain-containing protein n=1 Tax=Hericium alpestre TaxID=135208 RepID=A0A4Y9ZUW9_9AGAM|nr:hypothetical protein EWM64_g6180 [Hericium alpestre]
MNDLFSLEGMIAVVTGGGSGIGLMVATALEDKGATVYIVGRRKTVLEAAAKESSKHGRIIPLQGDITDRDSLLAAAQTLREKHGYINLLVNNAGVALGNRRPQDYRGDIRALQSALWNDAAPGDFEGCFGINVTGTYYCTVAFLDLLHEGNLRTADATGVTSQVLSVSSIASFRRDERSYSIPYTLSKVACTHMGKAWVNLLRDWKIRSNVLAPGIFPSDMTQEIVTSADVMKDVPLKRPGSQEDVAGTVVYLASRAGAYVNGTVHLLDGGRLSSFSSTY